VSQQAFSHPLAVRLHVPPLKWFLQDVPYTELAILQTIKHRNKSAREFVTQNRSFIIAVAKANYTRDRHGQQDKGVNEQKICNFSKSMPRVVNLQSCIGHANCEIFTLCSQSPRQTSRRNIKNSISFPLRQTFIRKLQHDLQKPLPSRTDNERSLNLRLGDDGRDRGKLRGN